MVTKCLEEMPPHHFSLTIFGNLEDFFVLLSLLSHWFVILIKYSRAQKEDQVSLLLSSLSIALELNNYLSD